MVLTVLTDVFVGAAMVCMVSGLAVVGIVLFRRAD